MQISREGEWERDCRFSGRQWGREIADLVGGDWEREIADLVGGSGGEKLQI